MRQFCDFGRKAATVCAFTALFLALVAQSAHSANNRGAIKSSGSKSGRGQTPLRADRLPDATTTTIGTITSTQATETESPTLAPDAASLVSPAAESVEQQRQLLMAVGERMARGRSSSSILGSIPVATSSLVAADGTSSSSKPTARFGEIASALSAAAPTPAKTRRFPLAGVPFVSPANKGQRVKLHQKQQQLEQEAVTQQALDLMANVELGPVPVQNIMQQLQRPMDSFGDTIMTMSQASGASDSSQKQTNQQRELPMPTSIQLEPEFEPQSAPVLASQQQSSNEQQAAPRNEPQPDLVMSVMSSPDGSDRRLVMISRNALDSLAQMAQQQQQQPSQQSSGARRLQTKTGTKNQLASQTTTGVTTPSSWPALVSSSLPTLSKQLSVTTTTPTTFGTSTLVPITELPTIARSNQKTTPLTTTTNATSTAISTSSTLTSSDASSLAAIEGALGTQQTTPTKTTNSANKTNSATKKMNGGAVESSSGNNGRQRNGKQSSQASKSTGAKKQSTKQLSSSGTTMTATTANGKKAVINSNSGFDFSNNNSQQQPTGSANTTRVSIKRKQKQQTKQNGNGVTSQFDNGSASSAKQPNKQQVAGVLLGMSQLAANATGASLPQTTTTSTTTTTTTPAPKTRQPFVSSNGAQQQQQQKTLQEQNQDTDFSRILDNMMLNSVTEEQDIDKQAIGQFTAIETLRETIPGEPAVDYPILGSVPRTSFDCSSQSCAAGYYADLDTRCQVFHVCQADGRFDSFLCPNGTIFSQQHFVCVWWWQVECSQAPKFYKLNDGIYCAGAQPQSLAIAALGSPSTDGGGVNGGSFEGGNNNNGALTEVSVETGFRSNSGSRSGSGSAQSGAEMLGNRLSQPASSTPQTNLQAATATANTDDQNSAQINQQQLEMQRKA